MELNFLDKAISFLNPSAGLKRAQARRAADIVAKHSGARRYEAAGMGRRTEGWQTQSTGANAETRPALRLLRDRMRDLIRNNTYAKRAHRVIGTSVIGTGIRPMPTGAKKGTAKALRELWKTWAESTRCDFNGQLTVYGMERQIMRTVYEGGEALAVRRRLNAEETKANGGVPIQLQILEGDYIDSARDMRPGTDGSYCIQGVEFDKFGRRKGYWLYNRHPGDGVIMGNNTSQFISAADVLHIYEITRPGAVRGVPMGASAMLRLMDFDGYEDAQLLRQKIAACYVAFYSGADAEAAPSVAADGTDTGPLPTQMQPGTIERLPAGTNVTMASPPKADDYDEYSRRVLQGAAAGLGVTYEQLTGDYANVNFTSGRMGRLEFEAFVEELQTDLMVVQFCAPLWNWFVLGCYQAGRITEDFVEAKWVLPGKKMVDPVKEVKANTDLVRAGAMSWDEMVIQQGKDPDEQRAAISASNKANDEAGIVLTTDPRKYTSAGNKVQAQPGGVPVV